MDCNLNLFDWGIAKEIYSAAELAIKKNNMLSFIRGGVVVGFSGGADSLMLLQVLLEYRTRHFDFPILAIHVNHMIRGDEALRDEKFAKDFCLRRNVDFKAIRVDVPSMAKSMHKGIEEAAREARYKAFFDFLSESRGKYSAIAVAHNATDNLETVLFNMMRGAGLSGLSGIQPVRDNIIRPLIYSSKDDIRAALNEAGIEYMLDSTNMDSGYTRNYIRNEIIPRLGRINATPEIMGTRLSENLRDDAEFIESYVADFVDKKFNGCKIKLSDLKSVDKAIFFRILAYMMREYLALDGVSEFFSPEKTHVDIIYSRLNGDDFSYCLPGGVSFVSSQGYCYIEKTERNRVTVSIPKTKLEIGLNKIDGFSSVVVLSMNENDFNYSNVYKISIQKQIPFDIINGNIYLRSKTDGDSYKYSNMTHKLKKLFCDEKIPSENRRSVPIFCDESGILWVPGFGVRDHGENTSDRKLYIAILDSIEESEKNKFYF